MKILRWLAIAIMLFTSLIPLEVGRAKKSQDILYFAVKIPETKLSEIRIDGDLSDWEWLAPTFLTLDDFPFKHRGDSREDFDVEAWVAWSPKTNLLYHAVRVIDDQLYTLPINRAQEMWKADVFEIYIDADHSGGRYRGEHNSSQAQQYFLYCLPDGKTAHLGLFGPEEQVEWSLKPPYAYYAARYDGKAIYYEVAMNLWDWLSSSPSESKLHKLRAREIIGWKITVKDKDGAFDHPIGCTLRPQDAWKNADYFANLMLMP